jgi:hypothetical protein
METAQPAAGEKIVVRCPRSFRVAFVLVGLFGAVLLADSLLLGDHSPMQDPKVFIAAIIMVVAAPVALLFIFNARIEIDGEEIAQYRGSRLLRRAPVRTIQEIRMNVGQKTLRFAGGEEFNLRNGWVNAAPAATFFQAILDARASARLAEAAPLAAVPMQPPAPPIDAGGAVPVAPPVGTTVTLPLHYVTFPSCCVHCGRPPTTTRPVSISRSMGLLFAAYSTTATVSVPVCRRCARTRKAVGPLAFLLYFLTLVGGIAAAAIYLKPPAAGRVIGMILLAYLFSTILLYAPPVAFPINPVASFLGRRAGGLFDRIFLGLRASRMSKDGQMITLCFRDADLAATVAELTERRRAGRLSAAKRLLDDA